MSAKTSTSLAFLSALSGSLVWTGRAASCPHDAVDLQLFEGGSNGVAALQRRPVSQWHYYRVALGRPRALRVLLRASVQAAPGQWMLALCPRCPDAQGGCLGAEYGAYFKGGLAGDAASAAPGRSSRWQASAPTDALSAQRSLWTAPFHDQLPSGGGWTFEVGVNDPALFERHGLEWFVAVRRNAAARDPNTAAEFRLRADVGAGACTSPHAHGAAGPAAVAPGGAVSPALVADISLGAACASLVPYSTLAAGLGHRGTLPAAVEAAGKEAGPACRAAAARLWCQQTHFMCDGADGLARRPCAAACAPVQGGWGGTATADQPCAALTVASARALNEAVCALDGGADDDADAAIVAAHSNFGGAAAGVLPCFSADGASPPGSPPAPCEPIHFTCETPECYLTARPLQCECVPGRDPGQGPECQFRGDAAAQGKVAEM
eukprot:g4387.t1